MSSVTLQIEHLPADVLGLSSQAIDTLAGRPRPTVLPEMLIPSDVSALPSPPDHLDDEDRASLARDLERELARFEPHVSVIESARKLAQPGATLVVSGQQPAFLGGPLYNVYKALHAVRLARDLSEAWKVPVIPAFWNHADDHDIAEVHHLWIQNPHLDLFKLGLASASSGREPLSRILFDEVQHRLGPVREALRQNLWEGEDREKALEVFLPRNGESFSNAFTRILLALFGHHGLLVIEPGWIREALSRSLARVVVSDLRSSLEEGSRRLISVGQEPAIDPATAALVFRLVDGCRQALRLAGEELRYDDESGSRTAAELAAEIVQAPLEWSPGALLRPVVQDMALPVAAYVGGWGELSYHAQLPPLRDRAGVPRTPFVPRLSATLVDPEAEVSLEKLSLTARDALLARGRLGEASAERDMTAPVVRRLREEGERAASALLGLREELADLDQGLAAQLRRRSKQVQEIFDRLASKAARVHANREGRGQRHFRRLNHGLFPRGAPQERVRGLLEFAARFGTGWMDDLLDEIEPLPTEHVVVRLVASDTSTAI